MRTWRFLPLAAFLAAAAAPAGAATLIDDDLNRNWGNWATHDTAAAAAAVVQETGGQFVITGIGSNDNITNAFEHPRDIIVTVDLNVTGSVLGGDWVGIGTHWTGVPDEGFHIQNRLTYDEANSQWLLEIWTRQDGDGYQPRATSSGIPAASLPVNGTTLEAVITRNNDELAFALNDAPGGTELASVSYTMAGADTRRDFGSIHVRSSRASGTTAFNLEELVISNGSEDIYTDDFEDNNLYPDWFAETAIAAGMAHYNFAAQKVGGSRADLHSSPGSLTIRGADDLRYSRVVSRYTTDTDASAFPFGYFGNVDARALVRFPNTAPANGYFEIGMRNTANEGTRVKALLLPNGATPSIGIYTGNYNTHTQVASTPLTGFTYTADDLLVLTVTSNGSDFTATVADADTPGTPIGTVSATVGGAAAAGQIVLSAGETDSNTPAAPQDSMQAIVEHFQVVDNGDTFPAFPAVTSVQDWLFY